MNGADLSGLRAPGSNLIPIARTIGISTLNKTSDSIPLPAKRLDWILLQAKYKVTDASISAGENFFGALTAFRLQDKAGAKLVQIESNEMQKLVQLTCGYTTGRYLDADPTTATDTYAYALIRGPWQLSGMRTPELWFEVYAGGEWATATAFEAEITAVALASDIQEGPGYYIDRQYFPTSTRHEVKGLGNGLVEDVVLTGAACTNTKNIVVNYGDNATQLTFDTPKLLNQAFAAHIMAANLDTFLLDNLDIPVTPGRSIIVNNSTTDTLLALSRSIVSV